MTPTHQLSVLVVDDEPDICSNLKDILSDVGYRVDCACDGPSAIELVRAGIYDVVLLDLRMPGMDGFTLYREIKKVRAGILAILITAYAGTSAADQALGAGVWQVLAKPVQMSALLGLLDQACHQPLVLVVDDDHDLCENLWQILRERGFRAALAHNTVGAAEQLRDAAFHIALIDMKLPGGDGSEVFQMVRKSAPGIRTILITGFRAEMNARVERMLQDGADAAFYKPLDMPTLLDTLDRLAKSSG